MKRYVVCLFLLALPARAAELDLSRAVVLTAPNASRPELKAVELLLDEVQKRAQIRWATTTTWPAEQTPVIVLATAKSLPDLAGPFRETTKGWPAFAEKEGYRLKVETAKRGAPVVFVVGTEPRGLLFGVGRLLRELTYRVGSIKGSSTWDITTAPQVAIRGHQLGYRPKTNSYDAWDLSHWEQYYRDLIVFGTNAVELIPPRSDDDADSPHFPRPPMEMMIGMSRLCADYDIDCWIWYPAMDADYSKSATVEFALKEWEEVFRQLPRIDAVFVPGGDPGHTQPKYLLALLEKQTAVLKRHHPKAQMWVSPQSFTQPWMDEFLEILRKEQPSWLHGIVHGPQVRLSLPDLRKAIPAKYPIRRYPDITHSLRCQYSVTDWDIAYAFTEAREVINPRPIDQANIFRQYNAVTSGYITYSEGCNDDVNKFVWSALGWTPDRSVTDIVRDYSHYFIGAPLSEDFAQGLLALERNWRGPALTNSSVQTTLQQFQDMERRATPAQKSNWRFQQALYRAYYDAYERRRLLYETELEARAMDTLGQARRLGSLRAMNQAETTLDLALTERVAPVWWARIHELAEALFQSIRMQLSVERYKAISVGRGATLDTLDVPLNNRLWLIERFQEIRALKTEPERLQALDKIVNWTDPGPGGFYDDLGDPTRQPHLVRGVGPVKDPGRYRSAHSGFHYQPGWRVSWCTHAETFWDQPLQMRYTDLDPTALYKVRIVYGGDESRTMVRLTANDNLELHPFQAKPRPIKVVEYNLPAEATRSGTLTLTWTNEPGRGGAGRGNQVAEVWLSRR